MMCCVPAFLSLFFFYRSSKFSAPITLFASVMITDSVGVLQTVLMRLQVQLFCVYVLSNHVCLQVQCSRCPCIVDVEVNPCQSVSLWCHRCSLLLTVAFRPGEPRSPVFALNLPHCCILSVQTWLMVGTHLWAIWTLRTALQVLSGGVGFV